MGVDDLAVELETIAKLKAENEKLREALKICKRDFNDIAQIIQDHECYGISFVVRDTLHRINFRKPIFDILDKTHE